MAKRKTWLKWGVIALVIIPTLAISSTSIKKWVQKIEHAFVVEERDVANEVNDNDPASSIILEDNFENNAAGWTFVNSSVNKWYAGFPEEFLEDGEASVGLFVSNDPTTFEYSTTNAAVSHAYKTFTIPTGANHLKVSFDWVCGGNSELDWDTWEEEVKDYMRVWIVPNTFVPTVDVPITEANGILLSPEPYLNNDWMVQNEQLLVDITSLTTNNVKIIFEWVNAANTFGEVPAAIRNLLIEDASCGVIEDLPFIEGFSPESLTRHCWTIVDANEDGATWEFREEYFSNEDEEYISSYGAVINTDFNDGENDDWLISPPIRLTGNQRLRYSYRVASSNEPNDFRVVLSTNGIGVNNFTRVLVPLAEYENTFLIEETVNLTDASGDLISGDVHIAWHVPLGGLDGWKLMITNVVIEDIPLCPTPSAIQISNLGMDTATVTWTPGNQESGWEVAVQPLNTGIPTAGTSTTQPTYLAENLTANTDYEVYVRAKCGVDDDGNDIFSDWVGPNRFRTLLPLTPLPYTEDFEDEPEYGFSNDAINQWVIGTAVNNGGTHALYITNDEGVSNIYDTGTTQVSHAYKDFAIPADAADLTVSFDWQNVGESWSDYFKVWLVPSTFLPLEGRTIGTNSGGIRLDPDVFYEQSTFTRAILIQEIAQFAGRSMRLVFEWKNDGSWGTQPPAAIDNLNVSVTSCVRPSDLHLVSITQTTAEIAWTSPPGVTLFDVYVSTVNTAPADNAIPTYTGVTNPHTLINLVANTRYYVWIRSACSTTNKSFWIGPLDIISLQIPAELPWTDNFEGDFNWSTDIKETNRWIQGNAVHNGGSYSLYITEGNANAYSYNTDWQSVSHAYRDILIPEDANELSISYDWKVKGEVVRGSARDYFRLLKVPLTVVPTSGQLIPVNDTNQIIGRSSYVDSDVWRRENTILNVQAYQGQVIRLVFEWINDSYGGNQPPAAIDNINVLVSTCPSPINPIAEVVRYSSNVRLSWTPQGSETKWEVFTAPQGSPAPTPNTPGIIVEGQPFLILENVEEGQYFVYYVRAICTDGNGEQKAIWIGPIPYSYFLPPMCAELDGGIEGTPSSETDTYIICEEGPVTKKLEVSYFDIKKTDDYKVEGIEYNPPFPFFGGDMVDLVEDDEWSDVIDLGFDFCFYGKKYDKVLISTNGAITFSIKDLVEGGRYTPTGGSAWDFSAPIPFLPTGTSAPFVDAIFGVYQDSDPSDSPDNYSINYQILGTFPCRALVFNMYQVGMFSCGYDPNDIEGSTQTTQIVLYEGTNIIEVYVKNRKPCMDWQNGVGLIGIQGNDGIHGIAAPNRNTGDWTTTNEAWRFTPDGDSSVDFAWYKDGEVFSTEEAIEVVIEESTNYTAKAIYESCDGSDLVIERIFNFIKEDFELPALTSYYVCGSKTDGGKASIDISSNKDLIFETLGVGSQDKYSVTYYGDAALTIPLDDVVEVSTKQTIYVKVINLTTQCQKIVTFEAIRIAPIQVTKNQDVEVCASFELPILKEGEQYFSKPGGQGIAYQAGDSYDVVGETTLYIYKKGEHDCYGESSFKLKIHQVIVADVIPDQTLQCEVFTLPALSAGNTYHTEPNRGGVELMEGMEIIMPMTIYIYAKNGSDKVFCHDESSFTVNYEDCPLPKGFSPNGDGVNDSFDLTEYGVAKIQVFNRNGVEVYSHGLGYKNQWMGQDKSGNKLPSGTYYYIVISNGKSRTGWVQLNY